MSWFDLIERFGPGLGLACIVIMGMSYVLKILWKAYLEERDHNRGLQERLAQLHVDATVAHEESAAALKELTARIRDHQG